MIEAIDFVISINEKQLVVISGFLKKNFFLKKITIRIYRSFLTFAKLR